MNADLDTLACQLYAPEDGILPGVRPEAGSGQPERVSSSMPSSSAAGFARSRERFDAVLAWLEGEEAAALRHGELEARLEVDARELFCRLYQDHLDMRAEREDRIEQVVGSDGVRRGRTEASHERVLGSVFGQVRVRRIAYRARGQENLYPADGVLNLPAEKYSHGLRRLAAIESARGSFEDAAEAIERATGQRVAKRQVQELARRGALDFEAFYADRERAAGKSQDTLVLSCDGKGVVMRSDALRPATQQQAAKATTKLKTRLSKGEKRYRKRMAEVGAVYEITPVGRTAADILPASDAERQAARAAPAAKSKWLVASVEKDAASVVAEIFDEAARRDPEHQRTWVALVDGNNHQINRITAEAKAREAPVTILIDLSSCSSTYGRPPGAFTPRATPPRRRGSAATPSRSSPEGPPAWPARSAAPPPRPVLTLPGGPPQDGSVTATATGQGRLSDNHVSVATSGWPGRRPQGSATPRSPSRSRVPAPRDGRVRQTQPTCRRTRGRHCRVGTRRTVAVLPR